MAQSFASQHDRNLFAAEARFKRWLSLGDKRHLQTVPTSIQIQRYKDLLIVT